MKNHEFSAVTDEDLATVGGGGCRRGGGIVNIVIGRRSCGSTPQLYVPGSAPPVYQAPYVPPVTYQQPAAPATYGSGFRLGTAI